MKDDIKLTMYNRIFESISDLVLCMDMNGHIIYMNSSAQNIFASNKAFQKPLSIYTLIHQDFRNTFENLLSVAPKQPIENKSIPFLVNGKKEYWYGNLDTIRDIQNNQWVYLILNEKASEIAFEKDMMRKMLATAKHFIISQSDKVDYQMIAKEMKELSKAKYVAFNILEANGKDFRTAAIAGVSDHILSASKILGFDLIDKKWDYDPKKNKRIAYKMTTVFNSLSDLTGNIITEKLVKILEKRFEIGQVVVIRITKDDNSIGDFTIIMSKNKEIKHEKILEIFASQVGLFVEKKRTENNLKKIKERLSLVMEAGEHGFWDWNLDTDQLFLSKSFYKMLGYEPEDFDATLKNWLNLVHPMDANSIIPIIEKKIKSGEPFEEVLRLKCNDGSYRWVSNHGKSYFKDDTNRVNRVVGLQVDISALKRTEKSLEIINKRLASIIEATNLGTWEWYLKDDSVLINDRWAEIIGYKKSAIAPVTFEKWLNLTHPNDYEKVKKQFALVFNGKKEFYHIEIRMKHKKGHWVWVKSHGKVIEWTENKEPQLISGTHEDISKRKELEENLKESEKENRLLIERMEHGLAVHEIICDQNNHPIDYRFLSVNKKFEEQTGLNAKDIIGKRVLEILPKTEKYWIEKYGKVALTGEPLQYENYSREINRWFKVSAYSPKPLQFAVVVDDITDRKKIENDLFIKKEQFKTTLLSLGEGVISTDAFGNIVMMNKVAANLTEWNRELASRKGINEVFKIKNEIDDKIITDLIRKVLVSNKIISLSEHTLLISKSGNIFPVEVTASPIKDQDNHITGVVVVFNDISERREREKQIKYLSFHDVLTGLYNRRYVVESMNRLDVERNLPLSIIILDVNGLKLTNDAFGHEAGDQLLIKVSNVLKTVCRADDIIGRIGGDEFIIILPKTSKLTVQSIKERIIRESNQLEESDVVISLAVGYATKTSIDTDLNDIRIEADNQMYKNKLKYGKIMRNETINRIVEKINQKYTYEKEHTQEVAKYSVIIAKALGFRNSEVEEIKMAGLLHDIGKISIPIDLLMKPGKLTSREYDVIKRHPETSYQILKSVDQYVRIAKGVLHHHERWDGTGYPEGLKKEEIPLISRILAIADAYQSMTSERSYRSVKSKSEAISELLKYSEKQFDPKLVDIFINEIMIK